LKQVEIGTKKLSDLLSYVRDKKESAIFDTIKEINDMYLFDRNLAFNRKLTPDEFIIIVGKSIRDNSEQVAKKIAFIESEIVEIANALIVKDQGGNSISHGKKKKVFLKELLELEPKLYGLKKFYSSVLYTGIYNSVWNSLKCLAESCGYELDNPNYLFEEHDHLELADENKTNSSFGPNDLVQRYMRVKSADVVLNDNQRRPMSVTTAILKSSWHDDRKLNKAFLK
jgi:hypothetical protein